VPPTPTYWPQVVGEQATRPTTITSGLQWNTETYQTVAGAQRAQVMNVSLTDPHIRFGMAEAGNKLVDPSDEVISSMANRTGAVAGVNSDEFAINTTGQPMGMVVQNGVLLASPVASWPAEVEVLNNGQFEFTTETFTGTATDTTTGSTDPLVAVNRIDQDGLTAVTPYLGAAPIGASTIVAATVGSDGTLTIASAAKTGQTSLPQVPGGQEDLIARRGTQDSLWLQALHVGDTVTLTENVAPYGIGTGPTDVQTAVSGAAYLVQNGQMAVPVQGGGENNVLYPVVGIGVTKDGKHAVMVTFDGRESENEAAGLTRPQEAQWFLAHGIYNAIEFDSGGSAEMVARLPGDQQVSVLNNPADGDERPVANGLFIYSTEASAGPAVRAVVNGGSPLTVLNGTTEQVSAYATDADGNPASSPVQLSVQPPSLATVTGTGSGSGLSGGLRRQCPGQPEHQPERARPGEQRHSAVHCVRDRAGRRNADSRQPGRDLERKPVLARQHQHGRPVHRRRHRGRPGDGHRDRRRDQREHLGRCGQPVDRGRPYDRRQQLGAEPDQRSSGHPVGVHDADRGSR
jgi:hypothetical protein